MNTEGQTTQKSTNLRAIYYRIRTDLAIGTGTLFQVFEISANK